MSQKISPDVTARVDSATEESGAVPVIVTLAPGTDPGVLEPTGMTIGRVIESIHAVAGTVADADVLANLAALSEVERVEYDGEMFAL